MKKYIFQLLFTVLLSPLAIGQQNMTLYGMKELSQSFYVNPGFHQKNRVYVSLPLGLQTISVNHSGFTLNHLLEKTPDDSLLVRPDLAIAKMAKRNFINFQQSSELFGLGFKIKKKNFISLSATMKNQFNFIYPKGLFQFVNEGNGSASLLGQRASLDGLGIFGSSYMEYALGYNRTLSNKWSVGGRFKLLSGIADVRTTESRLGISTDSETFDITIDGQMAVKSSNSLYFTDSAHSDQMTTTFMTAAYDFKNLGFALDGGASYKLNDRIELSASVLDLGFISWKNNTRNYSSSNVNYTFRGVDLDGIVNDSIDLAKYLTDTLEKIFTYQHYSEKYTSALNARFYLGGVYHLNKTFSSSFTWHNQILANRFRTGFAVAMNMHVRNWLSMSVNYAAFGRSFNNLGAGLSLKGGPLQFYLISDNILSFLNPARAKNLHLTFGMNVCIGPLKDKDGDDIKDKKDDCPELFGKEEYRGCPDSDNDGVTDPTDDCPQVPGLKEFGGCPDRDRDRIIDTKDACPDDSGLIEFAGCPDFDGDKIIDKNDTCPKVKGLVAFNGCPDTDGDGIKDSEDDCPEIPGTLVNRGCPDADKDGLFDFQDECPEQYGPKENKGCPWPDSDNDGLIDKDDECPNLSGPLQNKGCPYQDSDNDGLLDKDDECPATPGPLNNKGCPEIEKEVQEILKTAFEDLEFETGKDIIKSSSFPSLNELAEVLKKKSEWLLQISGHTDNVGDDQKNLILSKNRAEAVKLYLSSKGIDSGRFNVLYFGETMPITSNDTPLGRQKNRRVEMKIVFR